MKNKKEIREALKNYIPIAKFISAFIGSNCEVLIRDYYQETSEIIYIVNGELSNRKQGEIISGYALNKIMKEDYRKVDSVSNYIIVNESNHKVFRSSTYFIKEGEQLLGMLCMNSDLTEYLKFREFYDRNFLYGVYDNKNSAREYFDESMDQILEGMIKNVILYWDRSIPVNKVELEANPIRQLYKLNVFKYKSAVNTVADLFGISPQTVYRYINEIEASLNR